MGFWMAHWRLLIYGNFLKILFDFFVLNTLLCAQMGIFGWSSLNMNYEKIFSRNSNCNLKRNWEKCKVAEKKFANKESAEKIKKNPNWENREIEMRARLYTIFRMPLILRDLLKKH